MPHVHQGVLLCCALVGGISALILFCIRFYANSKITWAGWIAVCFAVGSFASYGIVHKQVISTRLMHAYDRPVIVGIAASEISVSSYGGYQFDIRFKKICTSDHTYCETLRRSFRMRASIMQITGIKRGSNVAVRGVLIPPKPIALGNSHTTFADYLLAKDICCTMQSAKVISSADATGMNAFRNTVREVLWSTYHEYVGSPNDGIAAGIVYGEKSHISDALQDSFRVAGLSHIMVLSGSNVTIVLILILPLIALIRNRFVKFFVHVILFLVILFFLGNDPPLVRAVIMAALAYAVKEQGNPSLGFRTVCISAVIMASINPAILFYDVSFHLSFLATLGMVLAGEYSETLCKWIPERFALRETAAVTLAVSLFVYPYSMYQFGTFSVLGIFANIIVVPIIPIIMAFGAALIPGAAVSAALGNVIAFPFKIAVGYIVGVAHAISTVPFASIEVSISAISMAAIYFLLCIAFRKSIV